MIDLAKLTKEDIGRWVEYHGAGGEIERGRLKGWNEIYIFVVYHCAGEWDRFQDFTGAATRPADLTFIKMSSEEEIQNDD
jgi:hypothetical protein